MLLKPFRSIVLSSAFHWLIELLTGEEFPLVDGSEVSINSTATNLLLSNRLASFHGSLRVPFTRSLINTSVRACRPKEKQWEESESFFQAMARELQTRDEQSSSQSPAEQHKHSLQDNSRNYLAWEFKLCYIVSAFARTVDLLSRHPVIRYHSLRQSKMLHQPSISALLSPRC